MQASCACDALSFAGLLLVLRHLLIDYIFRVCQCSVQFVLVPRKRTPPPPPVKRLPSPPRRAREADPRDRDRDRDRGRERRERQCSAILA